MWSHKLVLEGLGVKKSYSLSMRRTSSFEQWWCRFLLGPIRMAGLIDNWLVVPKRSWRRCFLILGCRPSLRCCCRRPRRVSYFGGTCCFDVARDLMWHDCIIDNISAWCLCSRTNATTCKEQSQRWVRSASGLRQGSVRSASGVWQRQALKEHVPNTRLGSSTQKRNIKKKGNSKEPRAKLQSRRLGACRADSMKKKKKAVCHKDKLKKGLVPKTIV